MRRRTGLFLIVLAIAACSGSGDDSSEPTSPIPTSLLTSTTTPSIPLARLSGTVTGLPAGDETCDLVLQGFDRVVDIPSWEVPLPCLSATTAGLEFAVDVPPGEYVLRILATWGAGPPYLQSYMWYPGTPDHGAAATVQFEAGGERAWSATLSPSLGAVRGDVVDGTSGEPFGLTTAGSPSVLCAAAFEGDGFFTGMWIPLGADPEYRFDGITPGGYHILVYECARGGVPADGSPTVVDRWIGAPPFGDIGLTGLIENRHRATAEERAGAGLVQVPAGDVVDAPVAIHTVPPCLGRQTTLLGTRATDAFETTGDVDVIITMGADPSPAGLTGDDLLCDAAVEDPVEEVPTDWCIQDGVNLRAGGSTNHDTIGFLEEYDLVSGTGLEWIDPQNRPWYQITIGEADQPELGWFAGWFAVPDECPPPTWTLRPDGFGPVEAGDDGAEVLGLLERALGPPSGSFDYGTLFGPACQVESWSWSTRGFRVDVSSDGTHFYGYSSWDAGPDTVALTTPEGLAAGDSFASATAAYPGGVLTSTPDRPGLSWYEVAGSGGDVSLRFYRTDADPGIIESIDGGEDFLFAACGG